VQKWPSSEHGSPKFILFWQSVCFLESKNSVGLKRGNVKPEKSTENQNFTGRDIATLRKARGWSQEEAARRIGISLRTLCRWESGKSNPSPLGLYRLAQELRKKR
jgi:DNA-binding XRE family transcriptional regulator